MDRGYFKVGDKKFYSKLHALQEGTKLNIHPTWHFNEEIFDNIDWSKPINRSLESLYHERALQLREKYDYVIVLFSGGADSTSVLQSFIKNNIHVDEVYVYWPFKALTQKKIHIPNNKNIHGSNVLSEWDYSIEPKLRDIRRNFPKTKISINDYTDMLFDEFTDDLYNLSGHNLLAGYFMRQQILKNAGNHLKQNKKVCLVAGIDKPRLHITEEGIHGYFLDIPCYSQRPNSGDDNRIVELFYWTPDLPQLPVKSFQTVAYHIAKNKQHEKYFKNEYSDNIHDSEIQRAIVTSLIYKDWDNNTFQVGKSTSDIFPEHDEWIHKNFSSDLFVQSWKSNLKLHLDQIDNKYFKFNSAKQRVGFVGFISKMHKIVSFQ